MSVLVKVCTIILAALTLRGVIMAPDWPGRIAGVVLLAFCIIFITYDLLEKRFECLHIEHGSKKDYLTYMFFILVFSLLLGISTYIYAPRSLLLKSFLYSFSGAGVLWSLGVILQILKRPK